MFPNETAAGLAQLVPSVELLPVLDVLTPAMLEVDGRIDALVAVERHIALLQARSAELLAALEAGDTSADSFTRDHVAAALRRPPASMRAVMCTARDLVERLPATLALLRSGEVTQRHAVEPGRGDQQPHRGIRRGRGSRRCWGGPRSRPSPSSAPA